MRKRVRHRSGGILPPFLRRYVFLPALLVGISFSGCGDDTVNPPGTTRFGQLGEVKIGILAPLYFQDGEGELQQVLTWNSSGAWVLREIISYRGLTGDETVSRNEGDPVAYASWYASLITQLNERVGVELFSISPLPPVSCAPARTQVTVTIWDKLRQEELSWTRCAEGGLGSLKTSEAGPDLDALRVIQAAILVRDFTLGKDFASTYFGSVPFGTLGRTEDSGAGLEEPRVFFSVPEGNPNPPTGWFTFWRAHNNTGPSAVPRVDWTNEMAIVAAIGLRSEAGDSVEIRRIVSTGGRTQVDLFERIPGDFCSPAARDHYPVHIIVAPRTPLDTIQFSQVKLERVPCGE